MKVKVKISGPKSISKGTNEIGLTISIESKEGNQEFIVSNESKGKLVEKQTLNGSVRFEIPAVVGSYLFYVYDLNKEHIGNFIYRLNEETENKEFKVQIHGNVFAHKSSLIEERVKQEQIEENEIEVELKPILKKYPLKYKVEGENSEFSINENDPRLSFYFKGEHTKGKRHIFHFLIGIKKEFVFTAILGRAKKIVIENRGQKIQVKNSGNSEIKFNNNEIKSNEEVSFSFNSIENGELNCKDVKLKLKIKNLKVEYKGPNGESISEERHYFYGTFANEYFIWIPYGKANIENFVKKYKENSEGLTLPKFSYKINEENFDVYLETMKGQLSLCSPHEYTTIEKEKEEPRIQIIIPEGAVLPLKVLADNKSFYISPYTSEWILGRYEAGDFKCFDIKMPQDKKEDKNLMKYFQQISSKHIQLLFDQEKVQWQIKVLGKFGMRLKFQDPIRGEQQVHIGVNSEPLPIKEDLFYMPSWGALGFEAKEILIKGDKVFKGGEIPIKDFPVLHLCFKNSAFKPINGTNLFIFAYAFPLGILFDGENMHYALIIYNEGAYSIWVLERDKIILGEKTLGEGIYKLNIGEEIKYANHKIKII